MRRILISVLAAMMVLPLFTSCRDDQVENSTLTASLTSFDFPWDGGASYLSLNAPSDWSSESNADWVSITPSSGTKGLSNLQIRVVARNASQSPRSAVITIHSDGQSIGINVTQQKAPGVVVAFVDTPNPVSYSWRNYSFALTFNALEHWEIVVPDGLEIEPKFGDSGQNTVVVTMVYKNAGSATRTYNIGFDCCDAITTFTINQLSQWGSWYHQNSGVQPYGSWYRFGLNPCPAGYRMPTKQEYDNLIAGASVFKTATGNSNPGNVDGMWFGRTAEEVNAATAANPNNCVFFPASGCKYVFSSGSITEDSKGTQGGYWAYNSESPNTYYSLYFDNTGRTSVGRQTFGSADSWIEYPVRCIIE